MYLPLLPRSVGRLTELRNMKRQVTRRRWSSVSRQVKDGNAGGEECKMGTLGESGEVFRGVGTGTPLDPWEWELSSTHQLESTSVPSGWPLRSQSRTLAK